MSSFGEFMTQKGNGRLILKIDRNTDLTIPHCSHISLEPLCLFKQLLELHVMSMNNKCIFPKKITDNINVKSSQSFLNLDQVSEGRQYLLDLNTSWC